MLYFFLCEKFFLYIVCVVLCMCKKVNFEKYMLSVLFLFKIKKMNLFLSFKKCVCVCFVVKFVV